MTDEEIKEYWRTAYCNEKYDKEKFEKENIELRERIKTLEQIKQEHTAYTIKVETERTLVKEQLTKAKEILKKYHNECPSKYSFEDIDDMAEQFLSEVIK